MSKYIILDTFSSLCSGGSIDYDKAYEDHIEFSASDDETAFRIAEKLQDEHDQIYEELGATEDDLTWSPCYVHHIWKQYKEEDALKLEAKGIRVRVLGQDYYIKVEY